eukprot:CAMPEP_0178828524 /NCGR_PEP_ID=MMETSP0746-20121128/7878_1 /TAXON_ID=913974 /ORGANISM="Nitzschia punctata, Strain CCMP561" /LENGTH=783 /DNA_ID=CAMNT_0020490515 /DNA_START=44 /DNA_END=2395 /DNA_ORIENTATION=+
MAPCNTSTPSTTPLVATQPVYTHSMLEELTNRQSASVLLLSVGSDYLSQGKHEEAMSAFDAAFQVLSSPSGATSDVNTSVALAAQRKWNEQHQQTASSSCHRMQSLPVHTSNLLGDSHCSDGFEASCFSSSDTNTPVDTYHEDECDVGPRPFRAAVVPSDSMDVDVLQLIICYNQALVHHARKECSLALQLYNFITGTIGTTLSSGSAALTANNLVTLSRLAMRAHNNMGQIDYAERSEEQAMVQFETALGYARKVPDTSASNQLEIATILSNWCRVQWMLGRVDDTVYQALEEILRIRSNFLGWDHVDVASAHFNLGMAEYSRSCNDKALGYFMQYLHISSHRLKSNKKVDLDPIPGLIFVLLIKNDEKDDKMSQDLVWGLRTLQDKRQDLGPKNSEVASVLNFIGTLLFHQRELDHALLFFQEELRLEEEFMGAEDDVSVSVTCNNIGRILQELGRYPQAIYYYQRSLRHRYGDEFFGKSRSGCASMEKNSNNKDCAMSDTSEECLDKIDASEDTPASTMNLYSTVWYNLGLIHDKMGAFSEAIRAFRMSLNLRRAMLGRDHSDVACLLYNIGVLQMEQQLLNDATASFREALRIRRVAATGQLNDRHVVKTLQKLASLHKSKGNIKGALEACREVMQVLKASVDFDCSSRNKNMGMTLREISELHHAEGELQLALERAVDSFNVLRSTRVGINNMDDQEQSSCLEQETASLLLIGSLQHEACAPVEASATFAEAARVIHSSLCSHMDDGSGTTRHPNAATLLPLLEVSTMLASAQCAPEA